MAERTGLEPATPGVTGRYSNQLNYRSVRRITGTLNRRCNQGCDCSVTTRAHYKEAPCHVNVFSEKNWWMASRYMASTIASLPCAVLRYSIGVMPDQRLNAR